MPHPSKLGDYIPPTGTAKQREPMFSGFRAFCKAVLCLEKGADLKVKMEHYWQILGMVNREGNPILNVEMYYTADGLYNTEK